MISRLSAFAAVFAVLTTATLAFAASSQHERSAAFAAAPMHVQLATVVVIGHRVAPTQP